MGYICYNCNTNTMTDYGIDNKVLCFSCYKRENRGNHEGCFKYHIIPYGLKRGCLDCNSHEGYVTTMIKSLKYDDYYGGVCNSCIEALYQLSLCDKINHISKKS